ncbi:hypothetical protein U769_09140 [Pseudomonas aeruginosa MTB-1]|nr:hypothetical protein U769_09140 [Pseudomonas aeruginosa MTB-1]
MIIISALFGKKKYGIKTINKLSLQRHIAMRASLFVKIEPMSSRDYFTD